MGASMGPKSFLYFMWSAIGVVVAFCLYILYYDQIEPERCGALMQPYWQSCLVRHNHGKGSKVLEPADIDIGKPMCFYPDITTAEGYDQFEDIKLIAPGGKVMPYRPNAIVAAFIFVPKNDSLMVWYHLSEQGTCDPSDRPPSSDLQDSSSAQQQLADKGGEDRVFALQEHCGSQGYPDCECSDLKKVMRYLDPGATAYVDVAHSDVQFGVGLFERGLKICDADNRTKCTNTPDDDIKTNLKIKLRAIIANTGSNTIGVNCGPYSPPSFAP